MMLLATTNHVCQDVAVMPFLWVAPLALYLLSFIVAFGRPPRSGQARIFLLFPMVVLWQTFVFALHRFRKMERSFADII